MNIQYTYNLIEVKEYIQTLTSTIVEKINPEKVILFGSYAYGNPTFKSDIDLLVILKDSPLSRTERTGLLYNEMKDYYTNFSIDFIVYTELEVNKWANAELAFITSVIKKGKILYERKS
jgi:predicted nucleotidyltransferase